MDKIRQIGPPAGTFLIRTAESYNDEFTKHQPLFFAKAIASVEGKDFQVKLNPQNEFAKEVIKNLPEARKWEKYQRKANKSESQKSKEQKNQK